MTSRAKEPDRPKTFTYDEVGELIAAATRLQELADGDGRAAVTMEELQQVASELKISPQALAQALSVSHQTKSTVRERVMRKLIWFRHLGVYGASMVALTGFDLLPDGNVDWVPYPILGWGIVVGAHAVVAFSGKGSRLERKLTQREAAKG